MLCRIRNIKKKRGKLHKGKTSILEKTRDEPTESTLEFDWNEPSSEVDVDVCIIGGGIAGLVAGIHCHRRGLTYRIVSKEERHGRGMGFLLQGSALSNLRELGIDFKVKQSGSIVNAMILKEVDGSEHTLEQPDDQLVAIGRGEFIQVLSAELPPQAFIHSKFIGLQENDGNNYSARLHTLKLSNGMNVRTSLVVGADGCHSEVRKSFCEPDVRPPRVSLVNELVNRIDNVDGKLMNLLVRDKTNGQRVFRKTYSTCPKRGKIGLGIAPVSSTSLVWYCQYKADKTIDKFSGRHKKQLAKELLKTMGNEFHVLIELTDFDHQSHIYAPEFQGPPHYRELPIKIDSELPVAVLLGDSRGSFSPFTSQGTGAAIEDVACFFRHFRGLRKIDLVRALRMYDEHRRTVWRNITADGDIQEELHLNPEESGSRTVIPLCPSNGCRHDHHLSVCKDTSPIDQGCPTLSKSLFQDGEVNLDLLRQRAFNFRWAEQEEEVGGCKSTIPLTAADPDFPVAPCITEALQKYIAVGGNFCYGPSRGLPSFRASVARVLRERKGMAGASAEHVLATNSAATAIFQVVQSILSSSTTSGAPEVIVMDPIDFLLVRSVEKFGGVVRRWNVEKREDLDYAKLQELVNENTVMFSFCNPNNPMGRLFTPAELSLVGRFAERHDLTVLSDDIWSDIVFTDSPTPYTSIAAIEGGRFAQRTIQVFGFSKSFGLAGLRIGYICSLNAGLLEGVIRSSEVDFTADGASTLSQVAAQAAYDHAWPWLDNHFLVHLQAARDFCLRKCQTTVGLDKCHALSPQGTYVMLIDVRPIVNEDSVDRFVQWAATKHKVRVVPGNQRFFGPGSIGHIRICFATSIGILNEALERLGMALVEWSNSRKE